MHRRKRLSVREKLVIAMYNFPSTRTPQTIVVCRSRISPQHTELLTTKEKKLCCASPLSVSPIPSLAYDKNNHSSSSIFFLCELLRRLQSMQAPPTKQQQQKTKKKHCLRSRYLVCTGLQWILNSFRLNTRLNIKGSCHNFQSEK